MHIEYLQNMLKIVDCFGQLTSSKAFHLTNFDLIETLCYRQPNLDYYESIWR